MPILPNQRHEAFAQALAKGKTADEAYALAGYRANRGNATRMNANESIRTRVQELQAKAAEKAEWTVADRLSMLQSIALRTVQTDPRVAISAIAETNKMQGDYAPAKSEVSEPGGWERAEDRTWRQVLREKKPPPNT